jgi:hypothetical protein
VWAVAERRPWGSSSISQPRTQSSPQRSSLLGGDFRSGTTSAMRLGPLSPHQLAVPSKERLGRDYGRGPPVLGERPARRGKEGPIATS